MSTAVVPQDPGKIRGLQRVTSEAGFFEICALDHLSDFAELLAADPATVTFADVVSAEDVERGKPAPDPFLMALQHLQRLPELSPPIQPDECLAIEDTAAGVEAARAANMKVLGIAHTSPAQTLAAADLVRASLAETDLNDVLRRLES